MTGVARAFGSTVALSSVDFEVAPGEVHALLGENGAGKTTLVRILAGLDRPDAGSVSVYGQPVRRFAARDLRGAGVAMVQQHFTLVPTLTAGENLALARPEGRIRPRAKAARERVERLADRYGLAIRADVPAGQLSVGEQQRLELIRALDADARLLILDEPTAVLVDAEAERLLSVCRRLAEEGRAVVIITHRLGEVFTGCDRVTVLRRGQVALGGTPVRDHDRAGLARLMVGASPADAPPAPPATQPPIPAPTRARSLERLRVDGVSRGRLDGFDLAVAGGEIVGMAGVDGNGQADLEALLAGLAAATAGTLTLDGEPLPVGDPRRRVRAGVAYIPSDRYRHALAGPMSLADNLELGRGHRVRPARRRRDRLLAPVLRRWDVRTAGPAARASTLSGGNAQKLVLARELAGEPRLVVAAYPTRGLDPDAARMISERIVKAAAAGAAVVWFGAELDELFAVADRIVVLATGHAAGPFEPPYDRAAIGLAMAGGHR
ncbi:sugar ABC transporter [Phytohabitans rumicis]|uniref:Sugar ABC transporter n=2 Tax=Phytohabitans rumicis TaxID=1076125 RepID=A0A6V8KZG4_9ACTN|nr:sugar ABC transporter [Phytohabitans rumicis]